MALRAKKPEAVQKRLKCLFFGPAGCGKTTAAIGFPKPYLIDTEKGAENSQYAEILGSSGGVILQTNDFDEITNEVMALLGEKHDYQTLIIDPITTVYDDLVSKCEERLAAKSKTGDGTEFGRHYAEAKKQWKRLANLLMRLDMNVIVTSHAKNLYGDQMKLLGKTFDGPKGLDHLFDLVIEVANRGKDDRVGVVTKTRLAEFPDGDVIPFNYAAIAERYGRAVLERVAVPVPLATTEQVDELTALIVKAEVSPDVVEKWLDRANAGSLSELPAEVAGKCIEWCKARIKPAM